MRFTKGLFHYFTKLNKRAFYKGFVSLVYQAKLLLTRYMLQFHLQVWKSAKFERIGYIGDNPIDYILYLTYPFCKKKACLAW